MPTRRLLDCYEFGRRLLGANDLDPVYALLHGAGLDPETLRRWLLAYWCFYHVGTASWVTAPGGGYWGRMARAAGSKAYPRCRERRHFRGAAAARSVAWLRAQGEGALWGEFDRAATEGRALEAAEVMEHVRGWVGFGPWVAFKAADMLERLGVVRVRFSVDDAFYKGSPTEGAALLWEREGRPATRGAPVTAWAARRILQELRGYKAPPRYERPLGVQEAETICCKWKSYAGGHYHIGEDVASCQSGLQRYAYCKLARRLCQAGRDCQLW